MNKHLFLLLSLFAFEFLPAQTVQPVVQFGHTGKVIKEAVVSPDGQMLATTDGQALIVWDLTTGLAFQAFADELASGQVLSGLSNQVFGGLGSLNFSPDNRSITCTSGTSIFSIDLTSGKLVQSFSAAIEEQEGTDSNDDEKEPSDEEVWKAKDKDGYQAVGMSVKSNTVVLLREETIELRNLSTGQAMGEISLKNHEDSTASPFMPIFKVSPTGQYLLHNSKVFNLTAKQFHLDSPVKSSKDIAVQTAAFSPDGKLVATGATIAIPEKKEEEEGDFSRMKRIVNENNVRPATLLFIWDIATGKIVKQIQTTGVTSLAFSPDGKLLATRHTDNAMRVWDWQTGKEIQTIQRPYVPVTSYFGLLFPPVKAVCFHPNGKSLFGGGFGGKLGGGFGGDAGDILIWDIATGNPIRQFGAAIPPIQMQPKQSNLDSLIIKEVETTFLEPWMLPDKTILKGLRLLDLRTGRVPHAYGQADTIFYSPLASRYLAFGKGVSVQAFSTELFEHLSTLDQSRSDFHAFALNDEGEWAAGSTQDHEIFVWKIQTGELQYRLKGHEDKVMALGISPNDKVLVSGGKDGVIKLWSLETGKPLKEFKPAVKNKLFTDIESGLSELKNAKKDVDKALDVPSLTDVLSGKKKNDSSEENGSLGQLDKVLAISKGLKSQGFYEIEFSTDGKKAAVWASNYYSVKIIDLEKKEMETVKDMKLLLIQKAMLSQTQNQDTEKAEANVEQDKEEGETFDDFTTLFLIRYFKEQFNLRNLSAINPDWNQIALATKSPLRKSKNMRVKWIVKIKGKKDFELKESGDYGEGVTYSPDGKMIAASSRKNNSIRLWNAATGDTLATLQGHSGKIHFGPHGKTLISAGWDRQIKIWDLKNKQYLYSFIGIKGTNDYIIILPSGFYTASRRESKAVAFGKDRKAYPFEQFDLQFNRPDLLLDIIGKNMLDNTVTENPNQALAEAYYRAYQKRLEKTGFTEDVFDADIHLPEAEVANAPLSSAVKKISLKISAKDSKYKLAKLHVWVNDVPVFGKAGKDLRAAAAKTYAGSVELELSAGDNKVQVSVMNDKGAESLKSTHRITFTGQSVKPDLYLVTLGVTKFKDAGMNLEYPIKDLTDLTAVFADNKSGEHTKVVKLALHEQSFTLEKLAEIEATLKKTKVDDKVFFFIATHGLLDEKLDYFLATYDMDFKAPAKRGLSYDRLETMLDKIPARNKLVFIDACHAGELDKPEAEVKTGDAGADGKVKFRGAQPVQASRLTGQNSFELMKELFVDLRRGSGATIISSAAGGEFAIEGDQWSNSVFAYALLKAVKERKADFNNDKKITVSELQEYLPKMVSKLTANQQQPTYRMENISHDFKVW